MRFLGLAVAFLIIATAAPAHAMGVYITFELAAWSEDGTSALVTRTTSSSGSVGTDHRWIIVGATGKPILLAFTSTQDTDTEGEQIDTAACLAAAETMQREIAKRKIAGVTVHNAACKTAVRNVMEIDASAAKIAAKSWVAHTPDGGTAMRTKKLVLVFSGENGDSSTPAHVAASSNGKEVVADLRHL